ncbi:MAG: hypothetical protein R2762_21305 [Bryobacteraceae bacterium]
MLAASPEASGVLRAAVGSGSQFDRFRRTAGELSSDSRNRGRRHGVEWLAERADEFEARVAIKIIKLGVDSPEVEARFRQERQILARLRHPNITQVLDGECQPAAPIS